MYWGLLNPNPKICDFIIYIYVCILYRLLIHIFGNPGMPNLDVMLIWPHVKI